MRASRPGRWARRMSSARSRSTMSVRYRKSTWSTNCSGVEVGDQPPQRHARLLGPQVPHGVDEGSRGEVDDALLRSEPTELTVVGQPPPEDRTFSGQLVERAAHHERRQRLDGGAAQVVAPPDGEGHPDALVWAVGLEHRERTRVVGVLVHRVGAGQRPRRASADVDGAHAGDAGHAAPARSAPDPAAFNLLNIVRDGSAVTRTGRSPGLR